MTNDTGGARVPLAAVLSTLPVRPSPERLQVARLADMEAQMFEREARESDAEGRTGIAAAYRARARQRRTDAQRALGLPIHDEEGDEG